MDNMARKHTWSSREQHEWTAREECWLADSSLCPPSPTKKKIPAQGEGGECIVINVMRCSENIGKFPPIAQSYCAVHCSVALLSYILTCTYWIVPKGSCEFIFYFGAYPAHFLFLFPKGGQCILFSVVFTPFSSRAPSTAVFGSYLSSLLSKKVLWRHILTYSNFQCEQNPDSIFVLRIYYFYVTFRSRNLSQWHGKQLKGWACAGIFKQSMGARNRVGIGLSYRPTRLHSLAELVSWNRFLGSFKV